MFMSVTPVLQEKLEQLQRKSHSQISVLEDELAEVTAYKDKLERYVRELEQMNDDLERAKRWVSFYSGALLTMQWHF